MDMDDSDSALARAERARVNGAKSRGPVTEEGKARSSVNARRHGLYAERHLAAAPEEAAALEELRLGLVEEHRPAGILEHRLVGRLAATLWKLERADGMESALVAAREAREMAEWERRRQLPPLLQCLPEFAALERHQARLGRELLRLCALVAKWPARAAVDEELRNEPRVAEAVSRNEPRDACENLRNEPSQALASLPNEPENPSQINELAPGEPERPAASAALAVNPRNEPRPAAMVRNEPRPAVPGAAEPPWSAREIDAALDEIDRLIDAGRLMEALALQTRLRQQPAMQCPVDLTAIRAKAAVG